jgi:hypothetical protein
MLEEALGVLCRDRRRSAWWVASKSASGVLEKTCSMGLKPGEYGGRSTSVQPRHSIASFTHPHHAAIRKWYCASTRCPVLVNGAAPSAMDCALSNEWCVFGLPHPEGAHARG